MATQQAAPQQEGLIAVGKKRDDLELFRFSAPTLVADLVAESRQVSSRGFLHSIGSSYLEIHAPAAQVRDYLAGMTDASFLRQAAAIDCEIPERICLPN